jgi:hypothetical protein
MIDLEQALTDLAEHLDYPVSEQAPAALRRRLVAPDHARRTRALLVAAAVLVLMATSIVAIAPARRAVADWLGIGAVEIRRTDAPLPSTTARHPVPGATGAQQDPNAAARLAAARRAVSFPILTPGIDSAGALAAVDVDRRVPGGLVALSYPRFTVVEIATDPTQPPPLYKLLGAKTRTQQVTVNGEPGLWIASIHEIGYSDRKTGFGKDTVRRSGPVLLWQRAGVTYRIEGLRSLAAAQAVAASLR